ncbi:MAG: NUDIX hydrolase [Alphaproteobacteria bacterium]|nr:NUDIX hydrolase [Alphaproteobacteria bacterium]
MHRKDLTEKLERYQASCDSEEQDRKKILDFMKSNCDCFERSNMSGHITGSCWLEDYDGEKFLMTEHKKLKKWLPLGGHADGDNDIIRVAMREAHEESGLDNIELVSADIFDLSVHLIPEYKGVPAHYHYDIRFLLRASKQGEQIKMSDESTDLAWFTDIPESSSKLDGGVLVRMLNKWKNFRESQEFCESVEFRGFKNISA